MRVTHVHAYADAINPLYLLNLPYTRDGSASVSRSSNIESASRSRRAVQREFNSRTVRRPHSCRGAGCQATWTRAALADWIGARTRAFQAIGAVPNLPVPCILKWR